MKNLLILSDHSGAGQRLGYEAARSLVCLGDIVIIADINREKRSLSKLYTTLYKRYITRSKEDKVENK